MAITVELIICSIGFIATILLKLYETKIFAPFAFFFIALAGFIYRIIVKRFVRNLSNKQIARNARKIILRNRKMHPAFKKALAYKLS